MTKLHDEMMKNYKEWNWKLTTRMLLVKWSADHAATSNLGLSTCEEVEVTNNLWFPFITIANKFHSMLFRFKDSIQWSNNNRNHSSFIKCVWGLRRRFGCVLKGKQKEENEFMALHQSFVHWKLDFERKFPLSTRKSNFCGNFL